MGKISGLEEVRDIPSKVMLMYEAVEQLLVEGTDINDIRVSTITERAGIGKGTAYEYFDSKEDILVCAIIFYMRRVMEELKHSLSTHASFTEQIVFLLKEIEKGSDKHRCIVRYIHMMTDTSNLSCLVRERLQQKEADKYLLTGMFLELLEQGKERGEVRGNLPMDYMVYVLFSKILSYILCVWGPGFMGTKEEKLRAFVYQSILDELCEKNAEVKSLFPL